MRAALGFGGPIRAAVAAIIVVGGMLMAQSAAAADSSGCVAVNGGALDFSVNLNSGVASNGTPAATTLNSGSNIAIKTYDTGAVGNFAVGEILTYTVSVPNGTSWNLRRINSNTTTSALVVRNWNATTLPNTGVSNATYSLTSTDVTNARGLEFRLVNANNPTGTATVTVDCAAPAAPVLGVTMSHSGNAVQGGSLAYTITPSTTVAATTSATLTASFTLDTGMSYVSASGANWSCSGSGTTGSCTTTTAFSVGNGPTITLNTSFASNATTPLAPQVQLSGGGAANTPTATDSTVVNQRPTITAVSPTAGPTGGGTTVTITGTGFTGTTGAAGIMFGATNATGYTVNSDTQITATAPANSAGTVDVTVTTAGVTSATSSADQFTYVAAPTVTSLSPTAGPTSGGTSVTITGANLSGSTAVMFGATAATGFTVDSATQITATAPANSAGTVDVTVTTAGGTSATSSADQYTYVAAPTVTSLSPTEGPTAGGASVTLTGTNFTGATAVTFGATPATGFTVDSATQITATAPAGSAGTVDVRVTTAGGTSATSSADQFTYVSAPTVTSLSPTAGPTSGGTSVTITGANLSGSTTVMFGATAATGFTVDSATQITATAPANSAGTVDVTVTTAGGTSATSSADQYTYVAAPTVTSLSPTSGPTGGGASVTLTGTNFTGATAVSFGATPATGFTVDSATQITATSPALSAGTVNVRVTTMGGTSSGGANNQYTYIAAPTASAASSSISYDTAKAIDLSGSITGAHSSIAVASAPSHGSTSVSGDVVTYTPTTGYFGADSFTYTATGPGGTSAAATVTLTVATPAAPTVSAASSSVNYDTAKAIDLSGSISGIHSSIAVASAPAHGSTSVAGDIVTYTPTTGYFGADSFTYTATGPGGTSSAATVTLTVATPAAPTASAASSSVNYNTAKAIDLSGSITGVHSSIAVASAPAHGSTSVAGDIVTYTPTTGYFGADSFTYTATGPGGTSAAATVTLTIATPAAPTALAASSSVNYDTAKAIDLSGSITGVHSSIAVANAPSHGSTSVSGDVVTYTPTTGYFGADSFTYTATGPGGTSAAATVTLTVATPAAPTASAASSSVNYDTAKSIDLSGSITGVHSSIGVASGPAHGTASVAGDVVTYTPTAGYFGADSFTYTATGPGGTSAPATVSLTVATPAAPTTASTTGVAVSYNSAGTAVDLSASITGVHASIAITSAPAHGTTSVAGDVVTYIPTAGYFGADSFAYTATGPGGTSAAATVSLTVATPAAPVAADKSGVTVAYNSVGTAIDLSASITGVHSSIAIGTAPAHGTVTVTGDVVTYIPTASYFGADSFTYTATGPGGTSAAATVTLTVTTPPAPTAANKPGIAVAFNSAGTPIDLTSSVSGVSTGIAIASQPAHGVVSLSGSVATYTPTADYFGADSFTYTATGPGGTSAAATVGLTVAAPPPPVAEPTTASTASNTSTTAGSDVDINLSALISGDFDTIQITQQPQHGTLVISTGAAPAALSAQVNATIIATYTPNVGYVGPDSFQYVAVGPGGTSPPATVSLVVNGTAPVAQAKTAQAGDGQTVSVELTAGATEGPFTAARIVSLTPTGSATANIVEGGTGASRTFRLDVTSAARFSGVITVGYRLSNAVGESAPATVTVTVEARPNPAADVTVRAISDAQAETARRFSRSQFDNFMRRNEQLHGGGGSGGVSLGMRLNTLNAPDAVLPQMDPQTQAIAAFNGDARRDGAADRQAVDSQDIANFGAAPSGGDGADDGVRNVGEVSFWTGGAIDLSVLDASADRLKIKASTSGLSIGADVKLSDRLTAGLGAGYGDETSRIGEGDGRVSAQSRIVAAYASFAPSEDSFIDGVIGFGSLDYDTLRQVTGESLTALGAREGDVTFGAISTGIERRADSVNWSVYGRAEFMEADLEAYAETGADRYNLRFDARSVSSLSSVLGVRLELKQQTLFGVFTPRLRGEWRHEFADADTQWLDYADIPGAAIHGVDTLGWDRDQFEFGFGAAATLSGGWRLDSELGAVVGSDEKTGTIRLEVNRTF